MLDSENKGIPGNLNKHVVGHFLDSTRPIHVPMPLGNDFYFGFGVFCRLSKKGSPENERRI